MQSKRSKVSPCGMVSISGNKSRRLLINLCCLEADYEQAVLAGKKALKLLGVDLSEADEWQAAVEQRVAAINELLVGRDILEIAAGPIQI